MPILPPQPLKMRNVFLSAACLLLTWPAVARASSTGRGVSPRAQQAGARGRERQPIQRPSRLKRFGRKFVGLFLSCPIVNERMRRDLLRYGPQFPDSYDPSNFSIKALVNTNWPMVVEYELEQGSTAVITIQVMEADPFTQTLVGEGMGKPRTARFTLPVYKGRGPHPALISFKARRDGAGRKERAAFHLSGVGAGKSAVASLPKGANGLEVASIGHLPLGGVRAVAFCPHGAVNVYCVTFNATSSGYEYNFYVGNKFDVWGADIVTVEQVGKTDKDQGFQVAFKPEPIGPDLNPLSDVWNGLGKDGRKARRGKYRVRVKAWLSAENTADWAAKHSESDPIEIN